MAMQYAEHYGLIKFAGSDNHTGKKDNLAGMIFEEPICDEFDFVNKVKKGMSNIFTLE